MTDVADLAGSAGTAPEAGPPGLPGPPVSAGSAGSAGSSGASGAAGSADLVGSAASGDPRVGLAAVASLRVLLDSLEDLQVASARRQGWSWQDIAGVLGVSRQAVHKKYGRRWPAPGR